MGDVSIVEFTVSRQAAEVVSDWLWRNGASAVVEAEAPDSLFPDVVSLTADLPAGLVEDLLSDRVEDPALEVVLSARVVGDAADDAAAARTWREFATPIRCGRFLVVPEWLEPHRAAGAPPEDPDSSIVRVRMEPGDAFGAGTHVTTCLCLEAVGDLIRGGESVLDLGSGTGVLGVAAAMIGARSVLSVDIDPEAVRVTRLVAQLNGVSDRVTAVLSDGGPDPVRAGSQGAAAGGSAPHAPGSWTAAGHERFDLVFANVLIGVIEENADRLAGAVEPGGAVVISGVLVGQRPRVLSAFHRGGPFVVEDETERDGWLRLVLRAPRDR